MAVRPPGTLPPWYRWRLPQKSQTTWLIPPPGSTATMTCVLGALHARH